MVMGYGRFGPSGGVLSRGFRVEPRGSIGALRTAGIGGRSARHPPLNVRVVSQRAGSGQAVPFKCRARQRPLSQRGNPRRGRGYFGNAKLGAPPAARPAAKMLALGLEPAVEPIDSSSLLISFHSSCELAEQLRLARPFRRLTSHAMQDKQPLFVIEQFHTPGT